jgi:flagellar hook-length control protein FliK
MDTATSMLNTTVAPAVPAPPAGPPAEGARTGAAGQGRSFAATLAHERPGGADEPASGDGSAEAAESPSGASAQRASGPAAKATKAPAKPATRPKATAGGGPSPADGNALPLWLPAAAPASATLASAAVAALSTPEGTPDVSAAGLPKAMAPEANRSAIELALSAPAQQPDAESGPIETAGTGKAAPPPGPSTPATADASTAEPALAKAATAVEVLGTRGPGPQATDDPSRKLAVAADAVPVATTSAPAAEVAASQPATAGALAVATAARTSPSAPPPKTARSSAIADDTRSAAAPAVDTAPVAPELEHAVTAALSADTKSELGATPAAAKVAVDAAAGALPQPPSAAPERAASPTVAQVSTPVGAPGWTRELADRVSVLVNQNLTQAQIKLSPADLGPIEVRISLSDGQANVSFTTHSHLTSEALQAAAPRLREVLSSQGYSSVNVDVAQQHFRERTPQQARYEPQPGPVATAPQAANRSAVRPGGAGGAPRLDAYA